MRAPISRSTRLHDLVAALGALLELDARVQVLGVLADDHEVDVVVARAHARVALARPDARVQVERLAQRDVDRAEARADGRRDRPLDRDRRAPDRVDHAVGQRVAAVRWGDVGAGLLDVPVELDTGRLEHPAGGFGELGPDAVARDQRHVMGQAVAPSSGRMSSDRPMKARAGTPHSAASARAGTPLVAAV